MAAQAWGSRFGFLMASIGFAVGLGNIWRFPYVTGENGGSAFVLVYLLCVFGIGVPILMAEVLLGRRGGLTPPSSMAAVAANDGLSRRWAAFGYLNLLTAASILVAYGVVAGWVLSYLVNALTGSFATADAQSAELAFDALLSNVPVMIAWSAIAMGLAGAILYAGLREGVERIVSLLMPLLFGLLVVLAIANVFIGGMDEALAYLFTPDFSKVNAGMLLAAVGQAFFSIGVAMAGMMMFGAYLPKHISIGKSALIIVTADTFVALLAGLVIFPMVFHNGLDPSSGTGLIFETLPVAFAQMPGGSVISVAFFLLLAVAAVTSVVGLSEPLVAWVVEVRACSRQLATVTVVGVCVGFGIVSVLSYNVWADVGWFGRSLGGWIDFLPNQIFLPLGGLAIAVFVGWRLSERTSREELGLSHFAFAVWRNLLRYVVVPAVAVIFIAGLGDG